MAYQYLIIGAGRMATHFCHYLQLLQIPFQQWSRNKQTIAELDELIQQSTHVLLLIKDAEIEPFYTAHAALAQKTCVHFSGSLLVEKVPGAHPLLSFAASLYDFNTYLQVPFVLEKGAGSFTELLPGLSNPHYFISPESKAYYHALCVMAGNFTGILWQKFFKEMNDQLGLPQQVGMPYLEQVMQNIMHNPTTAVTGPLARNDTQTMTRNLTALANDKFADVYAAFVAAYVNP